MRTTTRSIPFALLLTLTAPLAADQVSGMAKWDGPPVRRQPVRMDADPKCLELHEGGEDLSPKLLVGEKGGIQNVFVYVEDGAGIAGAGDTEPPSDPIVLTQHGCWYEPRVMGIHAKQTLSIVNDDPTLHNVRSLAKTNRPFNIGQPPEQPPRNKTFPLPENAIKFKCDVHPWMEAYIFVLDHPFWAVTDDSGAFTIDGLPAGKHTLVAWHEAFGERETEVEVSGETGGVSFSFSP
jgi:hypothetical protein